MCKKASGSKNNNNYIDNVEIEKFVVLEELEINYVLVNKSWIRKIWINGIEIEIKLDTGTEINVLSVDFFNKLEKFKLCESNLEIKSFGGYNTESKCSITLEIKNENEKMKTRFEVVEYQGLPLLSYEACVNMKYKFPEVSEIDKLYNSKEKDYFIGKNKDIFEGIGKLPDKIKIKLVNNVIPKSNPPRRVPLKMYDKLKEQLDRMIKLGLIERCLEPSEWQSNLVIIEWHSAGMLRS